MRLRRFGITFAVVVAVSLGQAPTTSSAAEQRPGSAGRVSPLEDCSTAALDSDKRLGPEELPTEGRMADVVRGWKRLGGMDAEKFLARYWDTKADNGSGGWIYPPSDGFELDHAGKPIEAAQVMTRGTRLDRFGSEYGAYLAPTGTPYAQRSLPPQSLDDVDPAYTCNYHQYLVVKTFKTEAGPIAPAFGQPGLGRQYQLLTSLLPDGATASVMWLVDNGYLQRVN